MGSKSSKSLSDSLTSSDSSDSLVPQRRIKKCPKSQSMANLQTFKSSSSKLLNQDLIEFQSSSGCDVNTTQPSADAYKRSAENLRKNFTYAALGLVPLSELEDAAMIRQPVSLDTLWLAGNSRNLEESTQRPKKKQRNVSHNQVDDGVPLGCFSSCLSLKSEKPLPQRQVSF